MRKGESRQVCEAGRGQSGYRGKAEGELLLPPVADEGSAMATEEQSDRSRGYISSMPRYNLLSLLL